MSELLFLKLGGSLLTDKRGEEALRPGVLSRLAQEIRYALDAHPDRRLLIGHGSGSFGHVAAAPYNTRGGVETVREWRGFAEVSAAAARLNRLVVDALLADDVPAITFQPSASAICLNGQIISLATRPVRAALKAAIIPVVYGDVAMDVVRGGTIISTEEILTYLAGDVHPAWLLLAGDTDGVYDQQGKVIPLLTRANFAKFEAALGGSGGTDVTGGMVAKVRAMLSLVSNRPDLRVRIFSGLEEGRVQQALGEPEAASGTVITR